MCSFCSVCSTQLCGANCSEKPFGKEQFEWTPIHDLFLERAYWIVRTPLSSASALRQRAALGLSPTAARDARGTDQGAAVGSSPVRPFGPSRRAHAAAARA